MELVAGLQVTPTVQLTRLLGSGGMGAVWLGFHSGIGTRVVVKFLADQHAANDDAVQRFKCEAAASAQVKSPHVVQVFDQGTTLWGAPYIVMEHLEGEDLGQLLRAGPLAPREVAEILRQASRALMRAHTAGVIHRDLKPDNIFLCDGGEGESFVKILDFGIAKVAGALTAKTQSGAVFGTAFYMSPEQVLGHEADSHFDLWALGVVAFECLAGRRPFVGETLGAVALAVHTHKPSPRMYAPHLPEGLDAWFAKVFASEKTQRYASAKELADAFSEAIHGAASTPTMLHFRAPMPSIVDQSTSINAVGPESANRVLVSTQLVSTLSPPSRSARDRRGLLAAGVVGALGLAIGGTVLCTLHQVQQRSCPLAVRRHLARSPLVHLPRPVANRRPCFRVPHRRCCRLAAPAPHCLLPRKPPRQLTRQFRRRPRLQLAKVAASQLRRSGVENVRSGKSTDAVRYLKPLSAFTDEIIA